jgi:N-hydroxyarylamine O-acetyltransferase
VNKSIKIDLEAYFKRIHYDGSCCPTLETLQAIHRQHTYNIAFENFNSFLKQPVPLNLESIQQKLIYEERGGYCFEQNLMLRSVLIALGFQVTGLVARVLWNFPEGTYSRRTHMLLQINIEEQFYIADVGFGCFTPTAPLLLKPNIEQATPHEPFRIVNGENCYVIQAKICSEWQSLYRFDLQEQHLPDYELCNRYVSTCPDSLFTTTLFAARPDSNCRYALRNNKFTIHSLGNYTQKRTLSTVSELRSVIKEIFRLNLDLLPNIDHAFQKVIL